MVETPDDETEQERRRRDVDVRRTILRVSLWTPPASLERAVVLNAIDDGATRQTIGDVLGMRRGAAYQRLRRGRGQS